MRLQRSCAFRLAALLSTASVALLALSSAPVPLDEAERLLSLQVGDGRPLPSAAAAHIICTGRTADVKPWRLTGSLVCCAL